MKYEINIRYGGIGTSILATAIQEDGLARDWWLFDYRPQFHDIYPREYQWQKRETRRHGWKITVRVGSWDRRDNTQKYFPEPSQELLNEVLREFTTTLKFCRRER